jgi:hypothetical protein
MRDNGLRNDLVFELGRPLRLNAGQFLLLERFIVVPLRTPQIASQPERDRGIQLPAMSL